MVEYTRPIAGVAPTDLWRPAMAKIQIGAPPLYHCHSDRLGTMPSFHSTTKHARYKEWGPAHRFGFGVAQPVGDLPGDMIGTFGVALSASVRTRQARRAHAHAQPTSTGAVLGRQHRMARNASDTTQHDMSSSPSGRAEGGAEPPVMAGPSARVPCASARQQGTQADSVGPTHGVHT